MASWFPSGDAAASFFFAPGNFRIFLGVSFGYLSRRLHTTANHSLETRLTSLAAAPTLPLSSLKLHPIPEYGELVLLQNGFVSPLSERLFSFSGREAVLIKTVEYTDQPEEFHSVYRGNRQETVSRVPFALVATKDEYRNGGFRVVVNADEKTLPLELDFSAKSPLDPPILLTKRDTRTNFFVSSTERSATIQVSKVMEQSVLGAGSRLENVFGRLTRNVDLGFPEILPCPSFPAKCFTMNKSEIEADVRLIADVTKLLSLGVGLLSCSLIMSGIRRRLDS